MIIFHSNNFITTFAGLWSPVDSLNLTRVPEDEATQVAPISPLANKTFIVTVIETPPYTMLVQSVMSSKVLSSYQEST